jgi:hypothetical protein
MIVMRGGDEVLWSRGSEIYRALTVGVQVTSITDRHYMNYPRGGICMYMHVCMAALLCSTASVSIIHRHHQQQRNHKLHARPTYITSRPPNACIIG